MAAVAPSQLASPLDFELVVSILICCSLTEVTQQSKARHKDDFLVAFSPVIAEAAAVAYKGAPAEVQSKLRRVVDVWRDRGIFEQPIQAAVEARMDGKMPASRLPNVPADLSSQNWTRPVAQRRPALSGARSSVPLQPSPPSLRSSLPLSKEFRSTFSQLRAH